MSVLDDIDGCDLGNGQRAYLLPKEMIELSAEIAMHHPELLALLNERLRDDTYHPAQYFGIIFAYCGIELDGDYQVDYLIEQASRALINKRGVLTVSINTIPTAQALVADLITH
jgi:hypothetical protein